MRSSSPGTTTRASRSRRPPRTHTISRALLGFAELLLDPATGEAQRAEFAGTIRRSGEHLLTILSDILDLAKLEADALQLEAKPVSPREILADVAGMLSARANAKRLALSFHVDDAVPAAVLGDAIRLRQILVNLVANAIKFTDQGSITVRTALDGQGVLAFAVTDTGCGIPQGEQELLFAPFRQVDNSLTRRHGGTGLGLAISQQLARMMGGVISVTSASGTGSTFCLRIPVQRVAAEACAPEPRALEGSAAAPLLGRILLAEDGPDNQRLICHILRRAGLEVVGVEDGQQALDALLGNGAAARPGFDLVLMDMQMPVMDGYEATSRLRAVGFTAPIVAITAHAMTGDRDRCLAAGCTEFLTKPIQRQQLIDTIRVLLHAR